MAIRGLEVRPNVLCMIERRGLPLIRKQNRHCIPFDSIIDTELHEGLMSNRITILADQEGETRKFRIDNLPKSSSLEVFNLLNDRVGETRDRMRPYILR